MTLTEEQTDYIATNLEFYGIASEELRNDLLDHICTHIEQGNFTDFDAAYSEALQKFGGYSAMGSLQRDTYLLTTFKNSLRLQMLVNILGFLALDAIAVGILFKFMHWPWASIIFCCGVLLLVVAFMPLYFYQRYKTYKKLVSR